MRHNILTMRKLMLKEQHRFGKLSVKMQYNYCLTICNIVYSTATGILRESSLFIDKRNAPKPDLSIEKNYRPPKRLNLSRLPVESN